MKKTIVICSFFLMITLGIACADVHKVWFETLTPEGQFLKGTFVLNPNNLRLPIKPDKRPFNVLFLKIADERTDLFIHNIIQTDDAVVLTAGDNMGTTLILSVPTISNGFYPIGESSTIRPNVKLILSQTEVVNTLAKRYVVKQALPPIVPIMVHYTNIEGKEVGDMCEDIFNGGGPGHMGWCTFVAGPGEHLDFSPGNLADNLTIPFFTQFPPLNQWPYGYVPGVAGLKASLEVKQALQNLVGENIRVLVWDKFFQRELPITPHPYPYAPSGSCYYRLYRLANFQIVSYNLAKEGISAIFLGWEPWPS